MSEISTDALIKIICALLSFCLLGLIIRMGLKEKSLNKETVAVCIFLGLCAIWLPLMIWAVISDVMQPEENRLKNIKEREKQEQIKIYIERLSSDCYQYAKARQECAVAGNYSVCMEIKGKDNINFSSFLCTEDGSVR